MEGIEYIGFTKLGLVYGGPELGYEFTSKPRG